jgi:hypothetical protein
VRERERERERVEGRVCGVKMGRGYPGVGWLLLVVVVGGLAALAEARVEIGGLPGHGEACPRQLDEVLLHARRYLRTAAGIK